MTSLRESGRPAWLRVVGSLWVGAVLLVLLLAALACATVYESTRGTEQALSEFYTSPWFAGLLGLLGVNMLAAVAVRFVFQARKIGFLLTHVSVVVILIGAVVTKYFGVGGQLALVEGESSGAYQVPEESVTLRRVSDGANADMMLTGRTFSRLRPVHDIRDKTMALADVRVDLVQFLPDSEPFIEVVNENEGGRVAVELAWADGDDLRRTWLWDGESMEIAGKTAVLTVVESRKELEARLAAPTKTEEPSLGVVKVEIAGAVHSLTVEDCRKSACPLPGTPYSIRVLEFYPHATVGKGGEIVNSSNEAINPAIRAEITGPEGTQSLLAFANFPDFRSRHADPHSADIKLIFEFSKGSAGSSAAMEVFAVSGGPTVVRFGGSESGKTIVEMEKEAPVRIPWSQATVSLVQRFDHAVRRNAMRMPEPIREDRNPALLVHVRQGGHQADLWLRKRQPQALSVNGAAYELVYADQVKPLGLEVKLEDFTVGYYPGGRRPRSFESRVVFVDPADGASQTRLISMNHPASFGGYTFYQSSYQQMGDREMSVLSVSRDPGQPVVFAGYIGLMIGMGWVLVVRVGEHRRSANGYGALTKRGTNGRWSISLPLAGARCVGDAAPSEPPEASRASYSRKSTPKIQDRHEVSR